MQIRRTTRRRGSLRRAALAPLISAALLATTAAPAHAGLNDTVSGVLGLTGILRVGNGFQLGLDEFALLGTPTRLSQVRAAIGGNGAASAGYDGTGIDVALIDTGAVPVPGLNTADAVVTGPDLSFDRQSGLADGLDGYGHGTHLAGIIAGRGDATNKGIAAGSRVVNVKVGASNGAVDTSQVIAAIDWVVQHRRANGLNIRVLNLSYGTDGLQGYKLDPLTHAIESAWRNGIVVVVAAGNTGGALTNPATDPYVLTVGAVDLKSHLLALDDAVAGYSSVGSSARRVDVVAPGTSIISLRDPGSTVDAVHPEARVDDRYFRGSGTSQAAAVMSGAVASLLEARPSLTPDQVKAVFRTTARTLLTSSTASQGAGMIDLGAALKATAPTTAQSFPRSTGLGSLEGSRGSVHVWLDATPLVGEVDVQGAAWRPAAWAPLSASGTAWSGGYWNGNCWTGTTWSSESGAWVGRTWKGDTWTGRTWKGDTWTGRTWKST
jgi:serine protease AprX